MSNELEEKLNGPEPTPTPGAFGKKFRKPLLPPFREYPSVAASIESQDKLRIAKAELKRLKRSVRNGRLSQQLRP